MTSKVKCTRGHRFKGLQLFFWAYFINRYLSIGGHMEAMNVPFHMGYGSLICFKGLQSDRPKCRGKLVDPSTPRNHVWNIANRFQKFKIFKSADNPESALSDEVQLLAQLWETAKWQPERLGQLLLSHHSNSVIPSSLKNMPLQFGLSLSHFLE